MNLGKARMNQKQKSRFRGLGPWFEHWSVYLAVTEPLTALGVLLGAVGHTLWPGLDRVLAQAAAGLLGFALGVAWCLRVGRRWLEEDEAGTAG